MNCNEVGKNIHKLLDGEISDELKGRLASHLGQCAGCQTEYQSIQTFQDLLKSDVALVQPSASFERVFWQKVLEQESRPWYWRVLGSLEALLPVPTTSQMALALLFSLMIGSGGGFYTAMKQTSSEDIHVSHHTLQTLSGFSEHKGLPLVSVAGVYFNANLEEKTS